MNWTAVVPLANEGERKTRLASLLDAPARDALAADMFAHVTSVLVASARIETVLVLSPARPAHWSGPWRADLGRGLNPELEATRAAMGERAMLIVHADLPLLQAEDIEVLLAAAEAQGRAIAPDRASSGTNALAFLADRPLAFRFGQDSFQKHASQGAAAIVQRQGLGLDLDTP